MKQYVFSSAYVLTAIGAVAAASQTANTAVTAESLLKQSIEALGGLTAMTAIEDVTYNGGQIYRSKSVAESSTLVGIDTSVASVGMQNVTFSFDEPSIKQRIERFHQLGPYWTWARPILEPFQFTLDVRGGEEGFASVIDGSFTLFAPNAPPAGYVDGLLAAFLINEAEKMSPLLLSKIMSNNNFSLATETTSGVEVLAVHDHSLGVSVIFDPETSLPRIIRSHEDHSILARSTRDLLLQDYTTVSGVQFPRRFKWVYNTDRVYEDYSVSTVTTNSRPTIAEPGTELQPHQIPTRDDSYAFSEISEQSAFYAWGGRYRGTLENLTAVNPYPDLPGVWILKFEDAEAYRQVVWEFDTFVVVLDCPLHQSHLIIQWIEEVLKKPLGYVWPSHHHHDHAGGVADYVKAGAKVIALDFARDYYATVPHDKFVTYTSDDPLILADSRMQASFVHMKNSAHTVDYGYSMASPLCPSKNSTSVIFDADDSNPTNGLLPNDQSLLFGALGDYARDRAPRNSIYVSGHGDRAVLSDLIEAGGVFYPEYTAVDYKYGGRRCV